MRQGMKEGGFAVAATERKNGGSCELRLVRGFKCVPLDRF